MAKTEKDGQPCYWANSEGEAPPQTGFWSQGSRAGVFVLGLDPITGQPANPNPIEPTKAMRNMPLL